ncbi:hypothetical protein [Cupriavidus taiwanensis]|uniref:hypothetical protein n=1 Tax=Cupriavidus taiwanensis TaxID=164546 RepID=UPI001F02C09B|nr:hypothetical protein [Cupriavidus taiwanensis]
MEALEAAKDDVSSGNVAVLAAGQCHAFAIGDLQVLARNHALPGPPVQVHHGRGLVRNRSQPTERRGGRP